MILYGITFIYLSVLIYLAFNFNRYKRLYKWTFDQFVDKTFEYKNKRMETELVKANFNITPSYYVFLKVSIMVLILTIMLTMNLTNNDYSKHEIIKNMTIGNSPLDIADTSNREIYLGKTQEIIQKYDDVEITQSNMESLKTRIRSELIGFSEEDIQKLSDQIYIKLVKLQLLKIDYLYYLMIIIISYYILDILMFIKKSLISLSKDFEMFNLYIAATIYTNIYESHKEIIKALRRHTKYNKYLFDELLLEITNGKEDAYKGVLEKIRSDDLFHLMNKLNIQYASGKKADFQNIADYKRRSLQATFTKRRTTKTIFAMIPIGVILVLSALYFAMAFQPFLDINNIVQVGGK